jgi:hypothetical protein
VRDEVKTRLRKAATVFKEAPVELREAILEAGRDGATNLDIAQEIDFAYSPDYIGKLISKAQGPRPPGRRPASRHD